MTTYLDPHQGLLYYKDLGFSHTLHVLKIRRRRREHPRLGERDSPVPTGPPILDDAGSGAGGPRRSRSPDSQREARIPSAESTLRRLHQRTSAVVCPSTIPPVLQASYQEEYKYPSFIEFIKSLLIVAPLQGYLAHKKPPVGPYSRTMPRLRWRS